ncbi:MAG: RrF2 family transcriptional regulator [Eubacteriales bacterium]
MIVSTRGRYALRMLIDMAQHNGEEYVTLKDVASRQQISEKYLESIIALLSKKGIVEGLRGRGGGYRLTRSLDEYTVGEIVRITDGELVPVTCLESGETCERMDACPTRPMWEKLGEMISTYLDSVKLSDLVKSEPEE